MRCLFLLILILNVSCNEGSFSVKLADPAPMVDTPSFADPCFGKDPGTICGGGKYAGEVSGKHLVATPAGCDFSATPTCPDDLDDLALDMSWDAGISSRHAYHYCTELVLNGFSDWYLPQNWELAQVYLHKDAIGGFDTGGAMYWSSTQNYYTIFSTINFSDGFDKYDTEEYESHYVRCVREATE